MTDARRFAPAATRNREPILEVLRARVPVGARVLEIGSGSGEHAVYVCAALPELDWQPSDPDPASRASIAAWTAYAGLGNIRPPLDIDVHAATWGMEECDPFDLIVSINMIHIAPLSATLALLEGAARLLREGGTLFLYGPFMRGGSTRALERGFRCAPALGKSGVGCARSRRGRACGGAPGACSTPRRWRCRRTTSPHCSAAPRSSLTRQGARGNVRPK
jgi:SAM-dependent methyltransferase